MGVCVLLVYIPCKSGSPHGVRGGLPESARDAPVGAVVVLSGALGVCAPSEAASKTIAIDATDTAVTAALATTLRDPMNDARTQRLMSQLLWVVSGCQDAWLHHRPH